MSTMPDPSRKPADDEIDVFGLTHAGKVRDVNQDHFLVCQLRKHITVELTSLPDGDLSFVGAERLAALAMVADGVGGRAGGEVASRKAIAAVARYVTEAIGAYYTADSTDHEAFARQLQEAVLRVHEELVDDADEDPDQETGATTLTMFIGIWPYAYLVQVGDSRHYVLRDGALYQETRDQTVRQALIDDGVLTESQPVSPTVGSMLASTIGGSESAPVVKRIDSHWGNVHLLCSDGLTRHVSDEQICRRLSSMTSAKQACEDLLQDALDDGGTDNVTIIVGRTVPKEER